MRDRDLVRLYWPTELRPAFYALFALDDAMAQVVATTSEPALGAIRLAWWRERLEELDSAKIPAEPRLQAAADELVPRGISGAELAGLEDGWLVLLQPFSWGEPVIKAIADRGRRIFRMTARLIGNADDKVGDAGALWALVDVARHCSEPVSRTHLLLHTQELARQLAGHRFARGLRPLTMLVALAQRDVRRGEPFEGEGTPGRAFALLRHRISGRVA